MRIPSGRGLHSTATQGRAAARPRKAIEARSEPPALPPNTGTRRVTTTPPLRRPAHAGGRGHGAVRHAKQCRQQRQRQPFFTMSAHHDRKGRVTMVHLARPLAEARGGGREFAARPGRSTTTSAQQHLTVSRETVRKPWALRVNKRMHGRPCPGRRGGSQSSLAMYIHQR